MANQKSRRRSSSTYMKKSFLPRLKFAESGCGTSRRFLPRGPCLTISTSWPLTSIVKYFGNAWCSGCLDFPSVGSDKH